MPIPKLPQRLLLIGYRRTGKTTAAKLLANKTSSSWIDTDDEVTLRAGYSVEKIFKQEGEEAFRDRETTALRGALKQSFSIIACGGGIVLREENRQLLQSAGITVLLEASPKILAARLEQDHRTAVQRPRFTNLSLQKEIETVIAERIALYHSCANLIINTENKTAEQVAAEILSQSQ